MNKQKKSKRMYGKKSDAYFGMLKMNSNSEAKTLRHRRMKEAEQNLKQNA